MSESTSDPLLWVRLVPTIVVRLVFTFVQPLGLDVLTEDVTLEEIRYLA